MFSLPSGPRTHRSNPVSFGFAHKVAVSVTKAGQLPDNLRVASSAVARAGSNKPKVSMATVFAQSIICGKVGYKGKIMPKITSIDHFVLTTADIDATVTFYTRVLGMKAEQFHPADDSTRWALCFGNNKINLHQAGAEFKPNAAVATVGAQDVCFTSDDPLDVWAKHFADCGVVLEEGPIARTGVAGKIMSLYIRDPDGNLIEVSNYV